MLEKVVGKSVTRIDGVDKLMGRAKYIDDISMPGMIYGTTVRSPIPRGRVKGVSFKGDIPWSEIVTVSIKDLPGPNCISHITNDQQCLAGEVINHPEEAVLLLAHHDRFLLERARQNVVLDIEALPAVLSVEDSLAKKDIVWGKDNIFKFITINKGNVEDVFANADLVVEGEYFTGAQEQLYIEPNGMISVASPKEGVTVWGSMQCPYYVHKALVTVFGLPKDRIRVIQAETGGGFGGKEDFPSTLACHAAFLSWKSGRPVKMIFDRAEDMVATTKRHPSRTRHRTAVTKDGKLLAMDIEFILDGGAYVTMSPVVLSRGSIHAAGPYNCPNIRINAQAVATNAPPHGAFRGFGAPQSFFALERHMNKIARKLGISAEEIRRRNFIKQGDITATGQTIRDNIDMNLLLDSALEHLRKPAKNLVNAKTGIGFSAFMHGAGFTGGGEKFLASVAAVEASAEGKVRVLASSTDIGQGAKTVFAQIAAEALGIPFAAIEVPSPDTSEVPNSGPTVASRTTMIVGKLVEDASHNLRVALTQAGLLKQEYSYDDFKEACRNHHAKLGKLKVYSEYKQPPFIQWDDNTYKGDAYGTFTWAVYAASVSVDSTTYETNVDHFVAVQEIGKVVNPILAEGQIEGGVVQGIGYTLSEEVKWKDGRMINNRMTNYIIPTAQDVPPIKVIFTEDPYSFGPSGAKGIGELPMDGVAPAILNAVEDATGISVNKIPMLPEDLLCHM